MDNFGNSPEGFELISSSATTQETSPDFTPIVTNFVPPSATIAGEVTFDIQNVGDADGSVEYSVYLLQLTFPPKQIPLTTGPSLYLEAGETLSQTVVLDPTLGLEQNDYALFVETSSVEDTNSSNNSVLPGLIIVNDDALPDLRVTDINFPAVSVGDTFEVSVEISNTGLTDAGPSELRLTDNNQNLITLSLPAIAAGEIRTVSVPFEAVTEIVDGVPQALTISATVDIWNDVYELDDQNNSSTALLEFTTDTIAEGPNSLIGTDQEDMIHAWMQDDWISTLAGDDLVFGGDGDDSIFGDNGNDTLDGGAGNDFLSGGEGNDVVFGGDDNDVIELSAGIDQIDGGDGGDTIDGSSSDIAAIFNLSRDKVILEDGTVQTMISVEHAIGTQGNNKIYGAYKEDNWLQGEGGNDKLWGRTGDDTLDGGDGNDKLFGQKDNDVLIGGSGHDKMFGDVGDDVFFMNGDGSTKDVDNVWGGSGADRFIFQDQNGQGPLSFERDTIKDWEDGVDLIEFHSAIVTQYSDLRLQDWGNGVKVSVQGESSYHFVMIKDVDLSDISSADFVFAPV